MKKKDIYIAAIIVAAGNGTRMGNKVKKQFMEINGAPVIVHTIRKFMECDMINEIIVAVSEDDVLYMYDLAKEFNLEKITHIVPGGKTRAASVKNGIEAVENADIIAIHDGARPCIDECDIINTIKNAVKYGASTLATKTVDTIKKANADGFICETIDRTDLWQMQTPQCFRYELINKMYNEFFDDTVTDDCMLAEKCGINVFLTEGNKKNIKITTKEDVGIAQALLKTMGNKY